MITLFSDRPEVSQRPYTFIASILAHGVATSLVALGIITAPKIRVPLPSERYTVRHLDLHTVEAEMQQARHLIKYPRLKPEKREQAKSADLAVPPPVMRQMVQAPKGPQTLLQPDLPKPIVLPEEIPLPTVVIWNGQKTLVKKLVAPIPEKPSVAAAQPSVQLPNKEQRIADIAIPSAELPAPPLPILPSTTSPVVVQGSRPTPPAPVTTTVGTLESTPTALMSLSDQKMANGDVALPPVNESASSNSAGALAAGRQHDFSPPARSAPDAKASGKSAGELTKPAEKDRASGQTAAGQSLDGLSNQLSVAHLSLPRNGQFGAVVVGSSMEDKYPESAPVWSGRLSYTVYLHVGVARSWILQYSLPRKDEAEAAGNIGHLESPWPFNIVRPNIPAGIIDADALMVHGFINQAGRFEALTVAFPPQFSLAQFVLGSLAQWQFRPATQNGQDVKVEVLLIIPEEPE